MRRRLYIVCCCALLLAHGAPAGGPADLEGLVGREVEVHFDVTEGRTPGGDRAIRLTSGFETAYRAGLQEILAILWDFPRLADRFNGIKSARALSDTGTQALVEEVVVVRALGLSFDSSLVYLMELERPAPGKAVLRYRAVDHDKWTLSSEGSWSLSEGEGPITYLLLQTDTIVLPRVLGQASMMRRFATRDLRGILQDLGAALPPGATTPRP